MITSHPVLQSSLARTAFCLAALFAVNAYICHNLFHTEFIQETASVDIYFMSFSRWLVEHWNDRSWVPMWIMGTPARQVYNPLLHNTVALLARISGWTSPHAYHFVTATTYCLGPITLFWLCYRTTRRHGFALLTGLLYSLFSPSALLVSAIRYDNGSLFYPRRFQTLVHYGEGPHVTALMLIPLVIWLLDEAVAKRRWAFLPLAPLSLAALVLTNWVGTTGLLMALVAYIAAKWGAECVGEQPIHWPTFIGVGILAYALASYWIPPSLIRTVQASSVGLDIVTPGGEKAAIVALVALAMLGLHFYFQRSRTPGVYRFFTYFGLITGTAVLSKMWFGRVLVPIAHRFQLEMEMALAGVAAFLALKIAARMPRGVQIAALIVAVVVGAAQARLYRREARNTTVATDVRNIPEYKMSEWLAANTTERVFASGTTSLWLNIVHDGPQFYGCCDQTVRTDELRMAIYDIYSGEGTGERGGEIATMWLKIYGVGMIGIADTGGDQPMVNPNKFDGVLEEAWRDGKSVVYRVPRPNPSLAHVVPIAALNQRRPENGIDIEPLQPLIAALDHPPAPATFSWLNQHEAEISARTEEGQALFVQETCDPGWRAFEGTTERKVSCGPMGLIVIDPAYAGPHTLRLSYLDSAEDRLARYGQIAGVIVLIVWTLRARRKEHLSVSPTR